MSDSFQCESCGFDIADDLLAIDTSVITCPNCGTEYYFSPETLEEIEEINDRLARFGD